MDQTRIDRLAARLSKLNLKQRQKLLKDIRGVIPTPHISKYCPKTISPKQEAFLSAPNFEVLFGGAAGGGKTGGILYAGLQYADQPEYAGLILSRTLAELELPNSIIPLSQQWLANTDAQWRDQKKQWTFPSGGVLRFRYLERDEDKWQYLRTSCNYIGIDGAEAFPQEETYTFLLGRIRRGVDVKIPGRMRLGSNPIGPGASWLKKRFITSPNPVDDGGSCVACEHAHWREKCSVQKCECASNPNSEPRLFVPAKLTDNPFIDQRNYRQSLAKLSPYVRRALEDGDWDAKPPGKMFRREWFRIIKVAPRSADTVVRFWDLAATQEDKHKNPSWTCGVRLSYNGGLFCVEDVVRLRETPGNVKAVVKQTAAMDGHDVEICIEQEGGSSGLAVIADYVRSLPAYVVKGFPASGSKESRAAPFAAQAEAGNVLMVEAEWNEAYLQELEQFPSSTAKNDQVDASAGAYNVIAEKVEEGDVSELWSGGKRMSYLE